MKFGHDTAGGNEWSMRARVLPAERRRCRGEQIIGNQANREQYPDLSAVIVQFGYRFGCLMNSRRCACDTLTRDRTITGSGASSPWPARARC